MAGDTPRLHVAVVYAAAPRQVVELEVTLHDGACVQDALAHPAVSSALAAAGLSPGRIGIWGRQVEGRQRLKEGDRVEVYRPLLVDPKTARRERFATQGARATGLFAKKRAGAKAGY
ncbi:hypothetical protein RD110_13395 [Rhodoferax koreense]|uniref:UPF0125 protein RD110_13395 n=1 Tax=Rhodoferax koreensis TaxID=1842727 RepID=A0A1P8JWD8_9BURK|nr:RnfH family protein [Rhodoferax koreense]APW38065.1 hypothetical protein RD110_13395 [Rhodoferax koreense]